MSITNFYKSVTWSRVPMNNQKQYAEKTITIKEREIERIFEPINDEIAILIANAKYNHTTCKTDKNTLNLTLAYIDDTARLVKLIKDRISLLIKTTN
jgi:hypothetical protein